MTLAGPAAAELRLGGSTPAEKVLLAKRWCDANATCTGFAIDPGFAVTLSRMLNTRGVSFSTIFKIQIIHVF